MTELIWNEKYNEDGNKSNPVRIALPFQTIETVNESTEDRKRTLDLFAKGRPSEWRNRLIWGDKKYILPSMLPEFAGKIDLIYIDPPFDTGADFSFTATIPDNPNTSEDETTQFTKSANVLEQKAYRDTWGKGLDSYLHWFFQSAIILRELLSENGAIYVHLDWHVVHYVKAIMDEIFSYDCFQREIIWRMGWVSGYKTIAKNWIRNHDTILYYTKDPKNFTFNKEWIPYPPGYERWGGRKKGQGLATEDIWGIHVGEAINSLAVISYANENLGYPTQKAESVLHRIIKASSNEGDLILDCFAGSGTTAAVAEKLNRRWIACDLGRFAIHTTRKRLLDIPNSKPFVVQNLGKYERQQWMGTEFQDATEKAAKEQRYRHFILQIYLAEPIAGFLWLHGGKASRMVHVGSVDSPVAVGDVKKIVQEFWTSNGKSAGNETNGVDILGWDFAFEINETAKQGDIKFYELASLSVETKIHGKKLTIRLQDFIVPPDDIPIDVQTNITHWQQWIDYWAVDWNFREDTFHNEWQSYRTKKDSSIDLEVSNNYDEKGTYLVVIKVIDLLGNDTTKMIQVDI